MSNNDLTKKSVSQLVYLQQNREVSSVEITQSFVEKIKKRNTELNAYLTISEDIALETAKTVDKKRVKNEDLPQIAGVPIGLKDMICTKGIETTAGSKILKSWIPPYNATLVEKIIDNFMPILGKHNQDEFAMGSSNEFSGFGPVKNPWNKNKVPGGSGGGSAASVAAGLCPLAVGTDTGGSIRQPSAFTGTVGFKPSYGFVSRYGVIEMSSSLDQPGPVGRSVLDTAYLFDVIKGYDKRDSTSQNIEYQSTVKCVKEAIENEDSSPLKGIRVGYIKELSGDGFDDQVLKNFRHTLSLMEEAGASIDEVSLPSQKYALAAYFLIMPAEVSSNLARFDGVRYGRRIEDENTSVAKMMRETRGKLFGDEVKRRILLGTHVLSAGYFDSYYANALKVRSLLHKELEELFENYDFLISPTTPSVAFNLNEKIENPVTRYMADIATVTANLSGYPAISIPSGLNNENLPIGLQILGPAFTDDKVFGVSATIEKLVEEDLGYKIISKIPF